MDATHSVKSWGGGEVRSLHTVKCGPVTPDPLFSVYEKTQSFLVLIGLSRALPRVRRWHLGEFFYIIEGQQRGQCSIKTVQQTLEVSYWFWFSRRGRCDNRDFCDIKGWMV